MSMILLDPGPVQKWLDDQHGGDKLLAFTRVMSPNNHDIDGMDAGGTHVGSTQSTRQAQGLELDKKSWLLSRRAGLLTLTASNFYVLRLGGLKEKIKETLFEAPRTQMRFAARDVAVDRIEWRHWLVTGFPDDQYLLEPQILAKAGKPSKIAPGSDAFLTELGDQASRLSPDAGTT